MSKPAEAGSGRPMHDGRARKRMIKQVRKVRVADVRRFIHGDPDDGPPHYFLLRSHGYELIRGWHPQHGVTELALCDDVLYAACIEYLKSQNLVFDSEQDALGYAAANVFPKMSLER